MFKVRVLSALLGIPAIGFLIYVGGVYFNIAVILISLIGFFEFMNAIENNNLNAINILAYGISIAILFLSSIKIYKYISFLIFLYIVIGGIIIVVDNKKLNVLDFSKVLLGIMYVPFLMSHLILLRETKNTGFSLIWLCFLCTWASDTFAYFGGKAFGRKKLCPVVSPKKTVEGAISGLIGSVIVCIIWAYFSNKYFLSCRTDKIFIVYGIIGLIGGVLSQFGDLTASVIKRHVGVKDYGNIIPGHGGIMDRFDSMLFVAPLVYYFITLFKF